MRILPLALIVIGTLGVARYLGLIPVGMFPLIGPVLLIALGAALLLKRSHHCHGRRHHHGRPGDKPTLPAAPSLQDS